MARKKNLDRESVIAAIKEALKNENGNLWSVAEKYGVSHQAISNHLHRALDQAIETSSDYQTIADEFGVKVETVISAAVKAGKFQPVAPVTIHFDSHNQKVKERLLELLKFQKWEEAVGFLKANIKDFLFLPEEEGGA